jgi:hypothetical protein
MELIKNETGYSLKDISVDEFRVVEFLLQYIRKMNYLDVTVFSDVKVGNTTMPSPRKPEYRGDNAILPILSEREYKNFHEFMSKLDHIN